MNRSIAKDALDLGEIFRNSFGMRNKIGYAIALGIGLLLMLTLHHEQFVDPFEGFDGDVLEHLQP